MSQTAAFTAPQKAACRLMRPRHLLINSNAQLAAARYARQHNPYSLGPKTVNMHRAAAGRLVVRAAAGAAAGMREVTAARAVQDIADLAMTKQLRPFLLIAVLESVG